MIDMNSDIKREDVLQHLLSTTDVNNLELYLSLILDQIRTIYATTAYVGAVGAPNKSMHTRESITAALTNIPKDRRAKLLLYLHIFETLEHDLPGTKITTEHMESTVSDEMLVTMLPRLPQL